MATGGPQRSLQEAGGKSWAAASARTLARRLRRQRQSTTGSTRAAALARRAAVLRLELAEHWRLEDLLHLRGPSLRFVVEAARLMQALPPDELDACEELASQANWARHAPAPLSAPRLPPIPKGIQASGLEIFRAKLSVNTAPDHAAGRDLRGGGREGGQADRVGAEQADGPGAKPALCGKLSSRSRVSWSIGPR